MLKHQHREFPSDVFLILETCGAKLHICKRKNSIFQAEKLKQLFLFYIVSSPGNKARVTLLDFLKMDMKHKIIYSIEIPKLSSDYVYRSYKVMPRAQNAHAHVNAGFLWKIGKNEIVEKPNIIFGGIRKDFVSLVIIKHFIFMIRNKFSFWQQHATNTEDYLTGKKINDNGVLQKALQLLESELKPDHVLPDYSPSFRTKLACGLFYKVVYYN